MTIVNALDLDALVLEHGKHEADGAYCVMEAVAYLAGEPWSDHPQCASKVLTEWAIWLNDSGTHEQRQQLVPFIPELVGTNDGRDSARLWWSVAFAVAEAERVLPIFEQALPHDSRPRQAVEAARAWLVEPTAADAADAADAAEAARTARAGAADWQRCFDFFITLVEM